VVLEPDDAPRPAVDAIPLPPPELVAPGTPRDAMKQCG